MAKTQINAYVADLKDRKIGDEYIENIPEDSIERLHRGTWKHLLVRGKDGNISVPEINPAPSEDNLPGDLYDALQDPHTPRVFCDREHPAKKWSIVALYVIIGVAFFVLFIMWVTHLPK